MITDAVLAAGLVLGGWSMSRARRLPAPDLRHDVGVSVIVPARNEAANLPRLLRSLHSCGPVVREVIVRAMKACEIPRRNADLAAASAIGTVMQPATYKVYGRFEGPLTAHARFIGDAAWAVLSVSEK